ncbi:uncharacterized protein LOC127150354 [Cucumis melo]|uniref:Uncharacterized protein LOC127150354 n=1 Tax=Cucumis melo TaxID=3656 RepID=A0ABM3L1U7_CUCME|nr:uncharacterized protein LOC127150354 [Cucumis melo]XP_050944008.1 uncharacterized protein LOC127150354 [Cucumis melo]
MCIGIVVGSRYLKNPEVLDKVGIGIKPPHGVLSKGPPRYGKFQCVAIPLYTWGDFFVLAIMKWSSLLSISPCRGIYRLKTEQSVFCLVCHTTQEILFRFCQNLLEQRSHICSNSLMYRHFCRFGRKISGLNVVI